MALSNLIAKDEHYGAVDLKQNATKYFSSSAAISIGIHVLVLLLFLGWKWFHEDNETKIPIVRMRTLAELAPPPSTSEKPQEAMPLTAPPPAADIQRPTFGVPIPVPDAVAPTAVMPDQNNLPVQGVPGGTGPVSGVVGGTSNEPVQIQQQVKEDKDPDPDEFVPGVDQDPVPVQKLMDLVVYPEIAKRAGLEGKVTLRGLVDVDGKVKKVIVDKSSGSDALDKAATEALMKARFTPATASGHPVKVWFQAPFSFKVR
jgi:protein TonB